MNNIDYKEIYSILNEVTPLSTDCGSICSKICGKTCCDSFSDDSDETNTLGMIVFPGEKDFIDPEIKTIRVDTRSLSTESESHLLAVCGSGKGTCNRAFRPLSCRIFPLFPTLNAFGIISVKYDLRGFGTCPLIKFRQNIRLDPNFVRRVRLVGRLIARNEEGLNFLKAQSSEIEEISVFHDHFRHPIARRSYKNRNFIS